MERFLATVGKFERHPSAGLGRSSYIVTIHALAGLFTGNPKNRHFPPFCYIPCRMSGGFAAFCECRNKYSGDQAFNAFRALAGLDTRRIIAQTLEPGGVAE